ncbi:MAG: phosphotransferase family protein [Nocardioides sp.]|nr:phosphotransferase family protein [Nocardioides sp.]
MSTADESRPVREEDAFDVRAVTDWLRAHADDQAVVPEGIPEVRQFPGGASNLTYLLRWTRPSSTGTCRDLILRRPPVGAKARSAHDMRREFVIQRALAPAYPHVARMVGLCRDESVIGSDFYVMECIDGVILRKELPFPLSPGEASTLCEHAWEALVRLHLVDVDAIPELAALGRGDGYVARQVAGWTDRLARAATDDLGDWDAVTSWLAVHQPDDVGRCLIHNDWRFDNMVLDPDNGLAVLGVLDWEMATVGDPLMDLGGALAYWVQPDDDEFFRAFRRQPTTAPGMWTREQIIRWYGERTGRRVTPEQWRFYEVFGLFRLAVIAQQIWYRYVHGQTHNEAYAVFGPAVAYLEQRCGRLVGA